MPLPSIGAARLDSLPRPPTPFIGRTEELVEVARPLADPACRLLTLVGPGGIGKTRLAIQAAAEQMDNFANGVHYVPLQPLDSTEYLVSAVADAIDIALSGQDEPRVQLLNYLRDKEMLLLLDNFEQLLPEHGEELLTDILITAPQVKLMVTSQEVLNLQEEWVYPVQGMKFPQSAQTNGLEAYEAIQLFVERAQRACPDFSFTEEQAHVIRICQLVEGMPLAIELATSWLRMLSCAQIVSEIQRNVDFLATSLRNVPVRQRSMRAVFDHSWQQLTEQERSVFKRLSVFRSGFSREAATRVTGASLPTLSALLDKSLLRSGSDDRYHIHELLRQYAAEHLVQSPEDVARVYDWHCTYFADFLHERLKHVTGDRQRVAVADIEAELENIRAAWQWAVELAKVDEIAKMMATLGMFCQIQSRFTEGANTFAKAAQRLMTEDTTEQIDLALVEILVYRAWFQIRLGWLEQAEEVLKQCRAIYRRLDIPPVSGFATDPRLALGIIASIRGDYAAAAQFGEEAQQLSEAHNRPGNRELAYYLLARAALLQGDYEAAQRHAQQAYTITTEINDRWFMAYCLIELGNVACALGDLAAARQHFEASYALRQEFDDPEGMAVSLNHLGKVAGMQGDSVEARALFEQSLAIYQKINDKGGLATSLSGLGNAAVAMGEYDAARQHFQQALQIATDIQYVPLTLSLLVGIGELLLHTGQNERGLELLSLALHHPASEHEEKVRVQQLLTRHQAELPADIFAAATQQQEPHDLETVTADLLSQLAAPAQPIDAAPEIKTSYFVPQAEQPLIEPLSERELEVLASIAAGLQNREIADQLTVTLSTVKTHINNIYRKLEVSNRVQAVSRARELNLL